MAGKDNKFLTFALGEESYGIPILRVREIIGMMAITHVPKVKDFMKGVINLRGKIIPIIDLRSKFGLEDREYDKRTCIIVIEIETENGVRTSGIVVDTVQEVIEIDSKCIDPPTQYGTEIEHTFLKGMGKLKDKVVMILETEKLIMQNELVISNEVK